MFPSMATSIFGIRFENVDRWISKSVFLGALKTPFFLFQFIATYFRKVDYSRFWSPWRPLNHMVFLHSEVLGYHIFSLLSLWHHHTSYYRESNFPRRPNHHQLKQHWGKGKNYICWNLWWILGQKRTLNLVSRSRRFFSFLKLAGERR